MKRDDIRHPVSAVPLRTGTAQCVYCFELVRFLPPIRFFFFFIGLFRHHGLDFSAVR